RIVAGTELVALLRSVRQLLLKRHVPLKAADDLLSRRMHFPAAPALLEPEQADDSAFLEVVGVALAIGFVPVDTGELRLGDGAGAATEVDRKVVERLASAHSGPMTKALSLLPSGSRK